MTQIFDQGRTLLEDTGGLSTYGLKEQIRAAATELSAGAQLRLDELIHPTILGVPLRLPFLEALLGDGFDPLSAGVDLLYQLPDYTW